MQVCEQNVWTATEGSPLIKSPQAADTVHQAIRATTGGLIRELRVETLADRIVITGSTDLFYNKQLVTRAAQEANVGIELRNDIRVCASSM